MLSQRPMQRATISSATANAEFGTDNFKLQLRRGSSVRVTNTADSQRCSQRADHIFGLKFLIRFARLRQGQIGTFIGRKPVALARPRAEIVRLASVRAEWPPLGIRCPCDRCTAHRTLDDARSFRHQNQGPAKGACIVLLVPIKGVTPQV